MQEITIIIEVLPTFSIKHKPQTDNWADLPFDITATVKSEIYSSTPSYNIMNTVQASGTALCKMKY